MVAHSNILVFWPNPNPSANAMLDFVTQRFFAIRALKIVERPNIRVCPFSQWRTYIFTFKSHRNNNRKQSASSLIELFILVTNEKLPIPMKTQLDSNKTHSKLFEVFFLTVFNLLLETVDSLYVSGWQLCEVIVNIISI